MTSEYIELQTIGWKEHGYGNQRMQRTPVPELATKTHASVVVGASTKFGNQYVTARGLGTKEKDAQNVR